MKLTENFTLDELLESQTARVKKIHEQFDPPKEIIDNLRVLCEDILQPFRDDWGRPVKITSGYRCERLNKAVNGVKSSAHTKGKAVDISISGLKPEDVIKMVETLIANGAKRVGLGWSFIHVDNDYKKPTPSVFLYGSKTPNYLLKKREYFLGLIKNKA